MKQGAGIFAAIVMLSCAQVAWAQPVGDVVEGRAASRRLCADCHAIDPGVDSSPKGRAPTFEQIANTPGMTGMALSAWLHSAHRTMPLLRLDARTREDITAYILSLKPQKQKP